MDDRWLWRHVDLTLYKVSGADRAGLGRSQVAGLPPWIPNQSVRGASWALSFTCYSATSRLSFPVSKMKITEIVQGMGLE